MAIVKVSMDTSASPLHALSPIDLELISGTLDLLCLLSYQDRYERLTPFTISEYSVSIDKIEFSSPLHIWATLRNISADTVRSVLDRTIWYKSERDRRELENQKLQQEVIELKLKNAERIVRTRRKLIRGGISEMAADRLLGHLLVDQSLSVEVDPRPDRPSYHTR
jgi:hypothetical protein